MCRHEAKLLGVAIIQTLAVGIEQLQQGTRQAKPFLLCAGLLQSVQGGLRQHFTTEVGLKRAGSSKTLDQSSQANAKHRTTSSSRAAALPDCLARSADVNLQKI